MSAQTPKASETRQNLGHELLARAVKTRAAAHLSGEEAGAQWRCEGKLLGIAAPPPKDGTPMPPVGIWVQWEPKEWPGSKAKPADGETPRPFPATVRVLFTVDGTMAEFRSIVDRRNVAYPVMGRVVADAILLRLPSEVNEVKRRTRARALACGQSVSARMLIEPGALELSRSLWDLSEEGASFMVPLEWLP